MIRFRTCGKELSEPCCLNGNIVPRVLFFSLLTALTSWACGEEEATGPAPVNSVTVTPDTTAFVSLGDTIRLTATARDAGGTVMSGETFSWSSSDQFVATVDTAGIVTATGNGTATITATADDVSGAAQVTVAQEAIGLSISPSQKTLIALGEIGLLSATVRDANQVEIPDPTITWVSSDAQVVEVGISGLITAVHNGSATIYASCGTATDSAIVTVDQVVATVEVTPDSIEFAIGDTARYTAPLFDANGFPVSQRPVFWTTADSTVATVDATGLVTAIGNRLGPVVVSARAEGRTGSSMADVTVSFASVSAGSNHTCALTDGGVAYCWGSNDHLNLGDSTSTGESRPLLVPGVGTFSSIVAGSRHTCAIGTEGVAYCWGGNSSGELGIGSHLDTATPTPVEGSLQFESLTAAFHTCGVTTAGVAYCWGENHSGEVGDSTFTDEYAPVPVHGGWLFRVLDTGPGSGDSSIIHTCGVDATNHGYCWGSNIYGSLGTNTLPLNERCDVEGDDIPCSSTPVPVSGGLEFRAIVVGGTYTCGLAVDGAAYCWGLLGGPDRSLPYRMPGGQSFVDLTGGSAHICGVTAAGDAYCWGDNSCGQLGNATTEPADYPVVLYGGHTFTALSAGREHTCGLTDGGQLYCWGDGEQGKLGMGGAHFDYVVPRLVYGSRR